MKTIYLVRHAQYANPRKILVGRLPVELSDEGREEAEKLSDFFSERKIDRIYTSSVLRCFQTSQIISQNEISIIKDLRLAETLSAYQGYWEYDWAHFYEMIDSMGGEKPQEIQDRMIEFWEDTKDQDRGDVIICSHGDPLYVLYAYLTKLPTPTVQEIYNIPDGEYQPKASVRPIILDKGKISVSPLIEVASL